MTTPVDRLLDGVTWRPEPPPAVTGGLPYVTHSGVLRIPGLPDLRCYVLSNGKRIFDAEDIEAAFGMPLDALARVGGREGHQGAHEPDADCS
jgi:hypothetical protein